MIHVTTDGPEADLGTFAFAEFADGELSLWRNTTSDPDAPIPDVFATVTLEPDDRLSVSVRAPIGSREFIAQRVNILPVQPESDRITELEDLLDGSVYQWSEARDLVQELVDNWDGGDIAGPVNELRNLFQLGSTAP